LAFDKEGFGEGSTIVKLNIKGANPGLPEFAYEHAYEILIKKHDQVTRWIIKDEISPKCT